MEKIIEDLAGLGFTFGYCGHCESVYYICPQCKINSCSGGGCDYCSDDHWRNFQSTALYNATRSEFKGVFPNHVEEESAEEKALYRIFGEQDEPVSLSVKPISVV